MKKRFLQSTLGAAFAMVLFSGVMYGQKKKTNNLPDYESEVKKLKSEIELYKNKIKEVEKNEQSLIEEVNKNKQIENTPLIYEYKIVTLIEYTEGTLISLGATATNSIYYKDDSTNAMKKIGLNNLFGKFGENNIKEDYLIENDTKISLLFKELNAKGWEYYNSNITILKKHSLTRLIFRRKQKT